MRGGEKIGFIQKGTAKVDVIEFLEDGTICIYDFKTGGARFKDMDMERYLEEGKAFSRSEYRGRPIPGVYVFPIFIPGRDGIPRQP